MQGCRWLRHETLLSQPARAGIRIGDDATSTGRHAGCLRIRSSLLADICRTTCANGIEGWRMPHRLSDSALMLIIIGELGRLGWQGPDRRPARRAAPRWGDTHQPTAFLTSRVDTTGSRHIYPDTVRERICRYASSRPTPSVSTTAGTRCINCGIPGCGAGSVVRITARAHGHDGRWSTPVAACASRPGARRYRRRTGRPGLGSWPAHHRWCRSARRRGNPSRRG